jgi:hypothetical protein
MRGPTSVIMSGSETGMSLSAVEIEFLDENPVKMKNKTLAHPFLLY